MKKVTYWEAWDGEKFDTEYEALEYEIKNPEIHTFKVIMEVEGYLTYFVEAPNKDCAMNTADDILEKTLNNRESVNLIVNKYKVTQDD